MFNALFQRTQQMLGHAIDQALNRALIAVPFIIAVGFGTSALTIRLMRELGSEAGLLAVALLFAIIGTIAAGVVTARKPARIEPPASAPSTTAGVDNFASSEATGTSPVNNELIAAALTSLAPAAVPGLARLLLRNWPLVAAIVAFVLLLSRAPASTSTEASDDVASS